jgi:hypothetical protein
MWSIVFHQPVISWKRHKKTLDLLHLCAVLGVQPGASVSDVKAAYRDLVQVWHPDRFGKDTRLNTLATEKLKEINEAYSRLMELATPSGYVPMLSRPAQRPAPAAPKPQPPPADPMHQTVPTTQKRTVYGDVWRAGGDYLIVGTERPSFLPEEDTEPEIVTYNDPDKSIAWWAAHLESELDDGFVVEDFSPGTGNLWMACCMANINWWGYTTSPETADFLLSRVEKRYGIGVKKVASLEGWRTGN